MRILTALPVLVLATCADTGVLQPETEAFQDRMAFNQANTPGALEFHTQMTLLGTVDPGVARITPSGVLHGANLVNEFAMAGDIAGFWYFKGKYNEARHMLADLYGWFTEGCDAPDLIEAKAMLCELGSGFHRHASVSRAP